MHSVGFLVLKLYTFTEQAQLARDPQRLGGSFPRAPLSGGCCDNPADWGWSGAEKEQCSYYSCVTWGEVETAGTNKAHS